MGLFFGIVIGLFVLVFLVVVHELGHAIAARRNGVVVEEFGIGFPPRAWGRKLKNGVLFSLNWLPIGGFVKLQGEHDSASGKGDYGAATFWQKTKILFAGVAVNWLVAVVLLTILALTGMPKIIENQFSVAGDTTTIRTPLQLGTVVEGYPAAEAGLTSKDEIISIAGKPVNTVNELISESVAQRGRSVDVAYKRNGVQQVASVTMRDADSSVFGATLLQTERIKATWSAPIVGVVTTGQLTWETLKGLGELVSNFFGGLALQLSTDQSTRQQGNQQVDRAANSVAGPVGILGTIFPNASEAGPTQVVFLAALISLSLAVMNVLPIPALDGGRWYTMVVYRLLRRPLTKEIEERIQGTGFLVLMGLIILITVGDVTRLFS